jgi:hypothetical protein
MPASNRVLPETQLNGRRGFLWSPVVHKKAEKRLNFTILKEYAKTHPEDEYAINLWGVVLDTLAKHSSRTKTIKDQEEYLKANAILEETKKGMKHWGTKWISDVEFNSIQNAREVAQSKYDAAVGELKQAKNELAMAKREYERRQALVQNKSGQWKNDHPSEYRGLVNNLHYADDRFQKAKGNVNEAESAIDRADAKIPRPAWNLKIEPVEPDFNLE